MKLKSDVGNDGYFTTRCPYGEGCMVASTLCLGCNDNGGRPDGLGFNEIICNRTKPPERSRT